MSHRICKGLTLKRKVKMKYGVHVLVGIWKQHDNHKEVKTTVQFFAKLLKDY